MSGGGAEYVGVVGYGGRASEFFLTKAGNPHHVIQKVVCENEGR